MAWAAPDHFDVERLRDMVRATYDRVARSPHDDFHFHRGPRYAVERLGYDARELASLPEACTARFAGVGNPLLMADLRPGMTVLDHACGAGTDLLLAALRVGPHGRAIGVDMTPAMREAARAAAEQTGIGDRVEIRAGLLEELPVEDGSVDVVISNGVINLSPDKMRVFEEVVRVLKPGGWLLMADVIVARELRLTTRERPELWAACVAGAMQESEWLELALAAGLVDACIHRRFAAFAGTSAERKVARDLELAAVNINARKPT